MRILLLIFLMGVLALPGMAQNHLLISEIQVAPSAAEFFEIYNPNPSPVQLDSIYVADFNTYYQITTGSVSAVSTDFLVKFPSGATIDSAGVLVVAIDGGQFPATADFEIRGTSTAIPDMEAFTPVSSAGLSNSEMLILFYWDGVSNRVYDIDYAMWGSTTSNFVDKSGVSPYNNDTPVGSQKPANTPVAGSSIERVSILETGETLVNGNGVSGHDETSESVQTTFDVTNNPTPGSTLLELPTGDGSGMVTVEPDSVRADSLVSLTFVAKGNVSDTVSTIQLTIPANWSWTGSSVDVEISGPAFSSASLAVNGNVLELSNAVLTIADSGMIVVHQLQSPAAAEVSVFEVQTAMPGGTLKAIDQSPRVVVWKPVNLVTIAEIQSNPALVGQQVAVEAIVTLGAGLTSTAWTDAYIQDESGAGINLYQSGAVDTMINRGYKLRIVGTVDEYNGVTEIINYTAQRLSKNNPLPAALEISTQQANDLNLEGTLVSVMGEVTDFAENVGGGTNIRLNDGSGECLVRVWSSTGVNLSGIAVGKFLKVTGPLDVYSGATQLLLAYQEDFEILEPQLGDGSGFASVEPDTVDKGQSNVELTFTISGEGAYMIDQVAINVPASWQWDGTYTLLNFGGATAEVSGKKLLISGAAIGATDQKQVVLQHLTAPADDEISTFAVQTATSGGLLSSIAQSPRVVVGEGIQAIPIALIQQNESQYLNQQVTIVGTVTIGAGITATSWTSAYVQDNSGFGINVYQSGVVDEKLTRGNLLAITGTVDTFNGVTEIVNYTAEVLATNQPIPTPRILTTQEANDVNLEGSYIEVKGVVTDKAAAGGGTNIRVDDGSGETLLRIWDSANLNLSSILVGDTVTARGVISIYQGAAQTLVGYQEDIFKPGQGGAGDGSGYAAISPDSVSLGQTDFPVEIKIWGNEKDTVETVQVLLPSGWQWSGLDEDVAVAGSGAANAKVAVRTQFGEMWVEVSGCRVVGADSLLLTLNHLSAPFDSLQSYFWVKTAVKNGVPTFMGESPKVVVGNGAFVAIRDLQTNSGQFKEPVNVLGIVTVGAGVLRTDRTSAYLQDASGYGINISASGQPDTAHYKLGNLVTVNGIVSEYNQTTQLSPLSATVIEEGLPIPPALEVSTGDANNPIWDGRLLKVRGVVTEKYTTSSQAPLDYNVVVNDGTGPITLRVWGSTNINLDSVEVNKAIIAQGVGGVFVDREGVANYQLLPAYQADIQIDPNYQPSLEGVSLDVPPNPFVPDRGEKIKIRYNAGAVNNQVTLRIFDLGGRMITTVVDKPAELIVETVDWDGRDIYLDYVPLGTYICHLEVLEPKSGKRKTRVAPIVVGTMLKK
ncbi:MAG: hypothetical protein Kow0037_29550 [Calditrichia bacterium]